MTRTSTSKSPERSETKSTDGDDKLPLYPIFNFKDNIDYQRDYYKAIYNDGKSTDKLSASTGKAKKTKSYSTPRKSTGKSNRGRRKLSYINCDDQYVIDAGQKDFDAVRCKTCNMLYTKGEYTDEQHHMQYHDMFVNSLKFKGWKNERCVSTFQDGSKILLVKSDDPKYMLKKVDDLFKIADLELGINVSLFDCLKPDMAILMYIHQGQRIGGFVVGEDIRTANEFNAETGMINIEQSIPAEIGVSRMWVHVAYRRKRIGTQLLDALRCVFKPGRVIPVTAYAFTDPTEEGQAFVSRYTGRQNILVFMSTTFDIENTLNKSAGGPTVESEILFD